MTPEGAVKEGVKKALRRLGIWFFMPVQNGMGRVGIPDIIGCAPITITQDMVGMTMGAFIAVETKAPGKIRNLTANQELVIKEIKAYCGAAVVVDNAALLEDLLDEQLYA